MLNLKFDLNTNERLGVAVSGGRDSMALLHLLLSQLGAERILVINIEHGIRGSQSKAESEFVVNHCKKLNVDCVSRAIDTLDYAKKNKLTTEQAARELRYLEFNRLIDEGRVNKIALAHHKGDQAETVMMRILRGTGINGLAGMNENTDDKFIRPLLGVGRKEINRYIKTRKIEYVDDESNFTSDYTRNFIRNEIFPLIAKKFPDYENALIRLSENAREDNDYIISQAVLPEIIDDIALIPMDILSMPRSILTRSIMACFKGLGVHSDIERRHIDEIIKMSGFSNGDSLDMPYDIRVYKEYDKLVFVRNEPKAPQESVKFKEGLTEIGGNEVNVFPYTGEGLRFDFDRIPESSVIRFREEGDFFSKFGGGTKSLGDYMTDMKIPRRIRNHIPLVASGKEILIICGYEISGKLTIDKDTKRIYTINSRSSYER